MNFSQGAVVAALFSLAATAAQARLTRFVVELRTPAGVNETLTGRFFGELDPKDPHNTIINDLDLAPRNARGLVEYSATFALVKPLDMSIANGVLFYSVTNRGGGTPAQTAPGEVSVVSGWQGDLLPRAGLQLISVPVAKNKDGSPLTGPVFERFINMAPGTTTLPLDTAQYTALTYQVPATMDTSKASLARRSAPDAPLQKIPASEWAFADCSASAFPGKPDPKKICTKAGFDPAFAYELVYTAKDPLVLGIGYAATRDLNSFLRYEQKDGTGTANPVAESIRWSLSRGNSQSGNFIRSFIHLGFNQDENNRIVWDGVNPHIAARQLAMNFRFALPGAAAGLYEPGSDGVLWWSEYADSARNHPKASLLDRCRASSTCPKVMETFGGLEFWYLRESPNLVGTDAKQDIPLPANVRRYFLPATTHGGGRGGFDMETRPVNGCVLPANPNPEAETMRALTAALVEWVTNGVEPPASRYPRLDRGELVPATGFARVGDGPAPNGLVNPVYDYDYGSGFRYNDLSGVISKEPPILRRALPTLVPKVDADGMDAGGVPSVLRQAPLGSYLGWNVVAAGFEKGRICGLNGGYVPFARTEAERLAKGDTRLSIQERYPTHDAYVAAVGKAANEAVQQRFLLREDAARLIAQAEASSVGR